ncbi:transporter substrate-binding domain-containing protein [Syntrophomonas wolfei]|uniref:transporter substrate-binding domain-containing protein n=1 Tax=Syntrophomonas wolfei TaxID=863 RepID=UPI00005739D7|nr:transporter substrate-binding domain-containing protein [Syntrophomonas wolfei]
MKKFVKLGICAVLMMALCISVVGCGKSGDKAEKFKVGMECGYPPFNWTQLDNSNGAVPIAGSKEFAGGYDVEIAKKLAEGMGKELVIVKTKWDGLTPAVQSGTIDGIIAGMSPMADRRLTLDFSDYYYSSDLVIVVKKGSKYEKATSLKDFAGAKITAQQNTFHYTVIDQIPNVKKQTAMADFPAMRVSLESGIIDGYVSEKPEGVSATSANAKFGMAEFAQGQGFEFTADDIAISVGIKKGNTELVNDINQVLAGISQEQRDELMKNAILNQPASQ